MGEAIDCALSQFDRNGGIDGLTTRVGDYTTRVEDLEIDDIEIFASGHPDLEVIDSGAPIEAKSISSFNSTGMGYDPLRNLPRFLRQTAFYQISALENKGFLALISRESGDVVCVQASPNNVIGLQRDWASWIEDTAWFCKFRALLQADFEGGSLDG